MVTIRRPSKTTIQGFLQNQATADFSYPNVHFSNQSEPVPDFDNDQNRVLLGTGQAVYDAACEAIRNWQMFPGGWARIEPPRASIQTGQTLAMVARVFGLHWVNACRIVYTLDGTGPERRFGFAYGTLPEHIECGEERFSVEWLPDDTVWYDLKASSKPRHWLVRLFKPVARLLQRRFVRASQRAMRREIEKLRN
ncbi:MAG: DUF1990 domain-containing protein [Saprospiraceae bacterium]|nr:DUF1990 domain-containing protein [Saprospiraceae bacterium]MCF8252777.1 DUF1990 domain-containing protein [Saprospiraceae bacterium]MCF8283168.1 DUF1990 domain-containing protein [Bacteroidales bacterium]MCF8314332.1 DUF1990 domain-containing protein [Saprospiraceae bacterium]MCF8443204.1 DUF1990 domain-containing protein [Saprospiraceae bacterium]